MNEIIWGRYSLLVYTGVASASLFIASFYSLIFLIFLYQSHLLFIIAVKDFCQKKIHIIKFSTVGRFRFFLESIRPELRQYYWESDDDEVPYSRNQEVWFIKDQKILVVLDLLVHLRNFMKMILFG